MDNTKIDYNILMKKVINELEIKPTLLLHSCCGPCSSSVIEKLKDYFNITIFYYNPNIFPQQEYEKRKKEQYKLLDILKIKHLESDYNHRDFLKIINNMENAGEGGLRCNKCIELRLTQTAQMAKINNFQYFCSTLSVSPHKNVKTINDIGENLEKLLNINYLPNDFKKEDGFLNSIILSKKYDLYRQDYCGCEFSKKGD